jgi:flagellar assembly protein FliH
MSDKRFQPFADAARVPVWTRPSATVFTAATAEAARFSAWADGAAAEADPSFHAPASNDVADEEALVAQGYAAGLAEGRRLAEADLVNEHAALVRLAESLEALKPAGADGLAGLLASTVKRLVTQIVGEVEINPDTLAERVQSVAAMITEETTASRLRLHPTDVVRLADAQLGVEIVGDPLLAPGTVVLDTGSGWVEDGPQVRLEKLRAALDRMGEAR